jgi:hypothetical protein
MRRPGASCRFGTAERDVLVADMVRSKLQSREHLLLGQMGMRTQYVLDRQPLAKLLEDQPDGDSRPLR